ncbi:MAG: hypothetical protein ACTSU9_01370 [Promethearchaeota archaeon]
MKEKNSAPKFNYEATDMLEPPFLKAVLSFEKEMKELRKGGKEERRSFLIRRLRNLLIQAASEILRYMELPQLKVDILHLPAAQVEELLFTLPFSRRSDLAQRPWKQVPITGSFSDIIVYVTAGTTAEPMKVPSHPTTTGCYSPMIKEALERWGIEPDFNPTKVGIALICFQSKSVTLATRLKALENSGFVKVNIVESEWRDPLDPYRYITEIKPEILTGDPFSFSELAHRGDLLIAKGELQQHYHPKALVTTAVALKKKLREFLESKFNAPVIDLYSLTETGPVGYWCKAGKGYHVLPHDIYLEAIDKDGNKVPENSLGEITITGGRNPFFPLIRYRTGDWGKIDFSGTCECGDTMPRIYDLEGRQPIQYHSKDGRWINNRDVTAILESFPITRFRFHQDENGRFHLVARLAPFDKNTEESDLEQALRVPLGEHAEISVTIDPNLGDNREGKVIPFTTDYPLFYE